MIPPIHEALTRFMLRNSEKASAWIDTRNLFAQQAQRATNDATRRQLTIFAQRAQARADAIMAIVERGRKRCAARALRIEVRADTTGCVMPTPAFPTLCEPLHTVPGEYVAPNNPFDRMSQALFSAQFKPLVGDDLASLSATQARPSPRLQNARTVGDDLASLNATHGRAA